MPWSPSPPQGGSAGAEIPACDGWTYPRSRPCPHLPSLRGDRPHRPTAPHVHTRHLLMSPVRNTDQALATLGGDDSSPFQQMRQGVGREGSQAHTGQLDGDRDGGGQMAHRRWSSFPGNPRNSLPPESLRSTFSFFPIPPSVPISLRPSPPPAPPEEVQLERDSSEFSWCRQD